MVATAHGSDTYDELWAVQRGCIGDELRNLGCSNARTLRVSDIATDSVVLKHT